MVKSASEIAEGRKTETEHQRKVVEKCVIPVGLPVVVELRRSLQQVDECLHMNILATRLGTSVIVVKTAISA